MKSKISISAAIIFLITSITQMNVWGEGADSTSYQQLIKKNFQLRKDLKILEDKFGSLENERKVLILHVKELQEIKDSRTKAIENLKGMIASLRIEMLKDPKLTKVIDSLNKEVEEAERQRDLAQSKVDQFQSEKKDLEKKIAQMEQIASDQIRQDGKADAEIVDMQNEVKSAKEKVASLEKEKKEIEKKMMQMEEQSSDNKQDKDTTGELAKIRKERNSLKEKVKLLSEEKDDLQRRVKKAQLSSEKVQDKDQKSYAKLTMELAKAKDELNDQEKELKTALIEAEKRSEDYKKKNERLERELKTSQASLKVAEKELQSELARVKVSDIGDGKDNKLVKELEQARQERNANQVANKRLLADLAKAEDDLKETDAQLQLAMKDIDEERDSLKADNEELKQDLQMAQISLENAEENLQNELAKVQDLEKELKGKTQGLEKELEMARQSLDDTKNDLKVIKMKKEGKSDRLAKEIKQLDKEKNELEKQFKKLDRDLQKASGKNQKLDAKITLLTDEVKEGDQINRQLMKDLKKEQSELARIQKELKKERVKSKFEREHYEEQLKFAKADKAMSEAKVHDLAQRALIAETKKNKIEEELKKELDLALLRESEMVVLREENSKLEKKLLKYIEQAIDLQDGVEDDQIQKAPKKAKWHKTKEQIAQQKLKMHYNKALAFDKMKMYKEEEREFLKCLKINPKDAHVHYNLAILYDDKLNNNENAVRHYNKYLQFHPTGEKVVQVKEWMLHAEQQARLGIQSR